jgi:exopolyphosphatase/guanosine-5'-triphosphate,3'-diphosphate pyrophosphatase
VERILRALAEAKGRIGFEEASVRAVTTEALRRARNGREVLDRIRRESGVRFEMIDGGEEARLTLRAVRARMERLGVEEEAFVLADIGGGSTELVYVYGERVFSRSFPLGIVTLSQEAGSLARVEALLPEKLKPLERFVREIRKDFGPVHRLVTTAGTPTTVAAMKQGIDYASYDSSRINGTPLYREELRRCLQRLLRMDRRERERVVGVGREDLIAAGILILEGIFRITGFEESVVVDDGLREGVALELCEVNYKS